jgi:AcrR family transcriptional regulator
MEPVGATTPVLARAEDLSTIARIRNAALAGFAMNGVAGTSIRQIAKVAGVSPGLIQHHFKTKALLREAVDTHVALIATETFGRLDEIEPAELLDEIGGRMVGLVRDHRYAFLYAVRAAAEADKGGLDLFNAFFGFAQEHIERLCEEGVLRSDIDRRWTALHLIVFNLGTVLLEPAIDQHLDRPFRDPSELQRWNEATISLFRRGIFPP